MTWTRSILLVLLALIIICLLYVGYDRWRRMDPDYYFHRAETAFTAEDFESTRVHLSILLEEHPDHAKGHALLSRVILNESRAQGLPSSYSAQPLAMEHLKRAYELNPQDAEVQRRLLRAYLQTDDLPNAAILAERIYAEDKTNGDAHLALTWRAVAERKPAEAERLFAESDGVVSRHVFQEFALKLAFYYGEAGRRKDDAKLVETYREAVKFAAALSDDELTLLSSRDREKALRVLLSAQDEAPSPEDRLRISGVTMDLCDKLQRTNLDAGFTAEAALISAGMLVQDSSLTHEERLRSVRRRLVERSGKVSARGGHRDGVGAPLAAYLTSAQALFSRTQHDAALRLLSEGIELSRSIGDGAKEQRTELHLLTARILLHELRFEDAARHIDEIKGEPGFESWTHLLRGNVALHDRQGDAALVEFDQAEKKMDGGLQLHIALARGYLMLEEWDHAIPHLEAMLVADGPIGSRQKQSVHLDLLRARLNVGQWVQSQANLRVLRETDLAPIAWQLVVRYLWSDDQREKAWTYLRRARDRFPDDINLVVVEVGMFEKEGKRFRAEYAFQDHVRAEPSDPVRKLAFAQWLIGNNPAKALRVLEELREARPQLTDKARNTLNVLTCDVYLTTRRHELAKISADDLVANPDTAAAGYMAKSIVAFDNDNLESGEQWLARLQLANSRKLGSNRALVQGQTLDGKTFVSVVYNVYDWSAEF